VKHNRIELLPELIIALVVCLMAIALPAAPAQGAIGPKIDLNHPSGVPGDELTVYGSNFTPGQYVDVYYDVDRDGEFAEEEWVGDDVVDSDRSFRVTFEVPMSYKGVHMVFAKDAADESALTPFTVTAGLTADPEDGPVGTNVTVEGVGFGENEEDIEVRYYFAGSDYDLVLENIEADENGSWRRSFPAPSSSRGNHRIDALGETSAANTVRDTTFEVTPAISILDQSGEPIDSPSGSPGRNITMTGSGFVAGDRYIDILFEDEETQTGIIRADDNGYWQGDFEVPAMPIGTYSVTAEGELTPEEDITPLSFEVRPGLVLSPASGHVGTQLVVTGSGFPINEDVTVLYDDNQVLVAESDAHGTFEISFVVPRSLAGERTVTAEDNVGNVATATFTMESDAPGTPELESPTDGSAVGFVGNVRPTFKWSAVPPDPSDVFYSLQIATGNNITSAGFADPVVSVDNIVATNYTLEKGLGYGNYYWIVQAVDGAGNRGQWTTPRSFHAGALPLWAFILAIVVFLALVGTLVYRLVIRERIRYL
jgi:hypothetical protein